MPDCFLRAYLNEVTGNPLGNLSYTLYRVVSVSLHTFQSWLRTDKYREQNSLRHTDDSAHIVHSGFTCQKCYEGKFCMNSASKVFFQQVL